MTLCSNPEILYNCIPPDRRIPRRGIVGSETLPIGCPSIQASAQTCGPSYRPTSRGFSLVKGTVATHCASLTGHSGVAACCSKIVPRASPHSGASCREFFIGLCTVSNERHVVIRGGGRLNRSQVDVVASRRRIGRPSNAPRQAVSVCLSTISKSKSASAPATTRSKVAATTQGESARGYHRSSEVDEARTAKTLHEYRVDV